MAAEEPCYEVERRDGVIELRRYGPQIVAQVRVPGTIEVAGNRAFDPLFRYISGANRARAEIPMTAPVTQSPAGQKIPVTAPVTTEGDEGQWTVSFLMPRAYTLDTLPEPTDPRVELREIPAHRVAAIRYAGRWTRSSYEAHRRRLVEWTATQRLIPTGPPIWARYNSPFTPPGWRRNEIWIPVEEAETPSGRARPEPR